MSEFINNPNTSLLETHGQNDPVAARSLFDMTKEELSEIANQEKTYDHFGNQRDFRRYSIEKDRAYSVLLNFGKSQQEIQQAMDDRMMTLYGHAQPEQQKFSSDGKSIGRSLEVVSGSFIGKRGRSPL